MESGNFLSIMALLVVVMGPFLVLSMVAVHAYASPGHKRYSRTALVFMTHCGVATSCINFRLLGVNSQPNLFAESRRSLFISCKWPAPAFILDNFVWNGFSGLSMLLAALVFGSEQGYFRALTSPSSRQPFNACFIVPFGFQLS